MQSSEAQYCTRCGSELQVYKESSYLNWETDVFMVCPNQRKWWQVWKPEHFSYFVRSEETVLDYDPITGERINVKRKSK